MNLAIVDPGPRQTRFYLQLRTHLAPDIRCHWFSTRPDMRDWIRSAGCQPHPYAPAPLASTPTLSESELHAAIGRKELFLRKDRAMRSAQRLLPELAAFLDRCKVDALLAWNGSNLQLSLAIYLARRRGLPVVYMENGYLPGTMQVDLHGVNYGSSLTREVLEGRAHLAPSRDVDAALDHVIACFKSGQRALPAAEKRPPPTLRMNPLLQARRASKDAVKQWYRQHLWRRGYACGLDASPLPEQFILLPLQVRRDSQLILHSPLVGNDLRRFLLLVRQAVRTVAPQLRIVAKFHPREQVRVQRRNLELLHEFPDVTFVSNVPMRELLARAAAIVTVNSTAGFEAFLYDKPVIALGRNFYTSPDLVEVAEREDEVAAAITRALEKPVPRERRRGLLRYAYARFFVQAAYDDYSERSLGAVAARLRMLLCMQRSDERLPSRQAELSAQAR